MPRRGSGHSYGGDRRRQHDSLSTPKTRADEDSRAFPLDVAIYLAHPLSWWISCRRGATTRSWRDKNTVGGVLVTARWPVGFRQSERGGRRERKTRSSFTPCFTLQTTTADSRDARVRVRALTGSPASGAVKSRGTPDKSGTQRACARARAPGRR